MGLLGYDDGGSQEGVNILMIVSRSKRRRGRRMKRGHSVHVGPRYPDRRASTRLRSEGGGQAGVKACFEANCSLK